MPTYHSPPNPLTQLTQIHAHFLPRPSHLPVPLSTHPSGALWCDSHSSPRLLSSQSHRGPSHTHPFHPPSTSACRGEGEPGHGEQKAVLPTLGAGDACCSWREGHGFLVAEHALGPEAGGSCSPASQSHDPAFAALGAVRNPCGPVRAFAHRLTPPGHRLHTLASDPACLCSLPCPRGLTPQPIHRRCLITMQDTDGKA